jgi:signal peptidase I
MKRLLSIKSIGSAAGFLMMILIWIFFAPIQVGGKAFYIIINGNSMEPLFHKGDLVILREAKDYALEDIVAYRNPDLGTVFHRIVGESAAGYEMQGDNNNWLDGYQPVKSDILGKYWIKLDNIGNILTFLRQPVKLAILIGALCLIIGIVMYLQNSKSNKNGKKFIEWAGNRLASWRDGYWWVMYALGIIGLILGVVCFTKPLQTTRTDKLLFDQSGEFSYTGKADRTVYDTSAIQTGEPVYLAITCNVRFMFDYNFSPAESFEGGGTYQLIASLQGNNGWRRNFELTPLTEFRGSAFNAEADFDVCQLNDVIAATEAITSVDMTQYSLIISPNINLDGIFQGQSLTNQFNPELTLTFDGAQLYFPKNNNLAGDPFKPAESGFITLLEPGANSIKIFNLEIPVQTGRTIALILVAVALVGIILPMMVYSESKKENEPISAKMLIGQALLETNVSPISGNERIVDLATLEDLAMLAERSGLPVFFNQKPYSVDYFVRHENIVYRFRQIVRVIPNGDNQYRNEIIDAINKNEFELYFQPVKSLQSGKVSQFEVLVRWKHPEKGFLTAGEFLPQAEANNVVTLIDSWVLENACAQLEKWDSMGFSALVLSVNIYSQQLKDPSLATTIQEAMIEHQVESHRLNIEFSMDQLTFDANVMNNLKKIKALGLGITVKGSDVNAFDKLYTIKEVDQVKLAPGIVNKVSSDQNIGVVARELIESAHKKNMNVTATGVETDEQMGFFQLNSCDNVQGYLVSVPLSSNEVQVFLKKQS